MRYRYLGDAQVCVEQIQWGSNRDPRGVLVAGESYEVERVEQHTWHTRVYLDGIDGHFNSVWFEVSEP